MLTIFNRYLLQSSLLIFVVLTATVFPQADSKARERVYSISRTSVSSEPGKISGVVTDAHGAVIPNAKVTLINQKTKLKKVTATGDNGSFQFSTVSPDTYLVIANNEFFKISSTEAFKVGPNEKINILISLEPKGITIEHCLICNDETKPIISTRSKVSDKLDLLKLQNQPDPGTTEIDFSISREPTKLSQSTVSIAISDLEGKPMSEALVILTSLNSAISKIGLTNKKGTHSFYNLLPGKYEVSVSDIEVGSIFTHKIELKKHEKTSINLVQTTLIIMTDDCHYCPRYVKLLPDTYTKTTNKIDFKKTEKPPEKN